MGNGRKKVSIKYAGVPSASEFSDEPLEAPKGETVMETVIVDEYAVEITAPEEAAKRFRVWIQAVKKQADYRDILMPTIEPARNVQFPLIGEELWNVSPATTAN